AESLRRGAGAASSRDGGAVRLDEQPGGWRGVRRAARRRSGGQRQAKRRPGGERLQRAALDRHGQERQLACGAEGTRRGESLLAAPTAQPGANFGPAVLVWRLAQAIFD